MSSFLRTNPCEAVRCSANASIYYIVELNTEQAAKQPVSAERVSHQELCSHVHVTCKWINGWPQDILGYQIRCIVLEDR